MNELAVKLFRGVLVAFSKLPLKVHYFFADIFTWFVKRVMKYRADVILVNLTRSFPDLKYWDLRKIWNEYYNHLGEIIAEAIWFSGSNYKRLYDSGIVTVTNPEELNELYLSTPAMTVLSTHCGNWELLGGFLGYRTSSGVKVAIQEEEIRVVYKKLSSDVSNEVFKRNRVSPLGKGKEECLVESSNVLRYAISHRTDKKIYVYPADQAPYWKAGKHFIGDFMNQPTNAMQGSMGVACKLSHSVLYLKMRRVERGQYEWTLIPICENASKKTPEELLRKYYDLLQEEIMETPANWLWSHKRWK